MSQAEYDVVEEESQAHRVGSRTASAALLAWFLHTVWRLEPEDIDDAICDGGGDKGIDALVVNEDLGEITVFQSKHRNLADKQQGDHDLKNLWGTEVYFRSPEAVDQLLASGPNHELRKLLTRLKIRDRVADGAHATRLVFVTNGVLDASATSYLQTLVGVSPEVEAWDCPRVAPVAERTRRPELRPGAITLHSVVPVMASPLNDTTEMAIGLIAAAELVALPGIEDLSLFDRNVRLSEGRTRINRELAQTVRDASEHDLFPAYHNGLTLLTAGLEVRANDILLDGIAVVNGCQSLLALHHNKGVISDALRVLVKVVQVDTHSDLTDKITYRTNNQNPVDIRDQRSSDVAQRSLQGEVASNYSEYFALAIREGETFPKGLAVFNNQQAAQLIMATYLREPWNSVRKVRLFDQDYRRIFNRTIDSHKLYLLWLLAGLVDEQRDRLQAELAASFASVRLTVAYLIAQLLRVTDEGTALLDHPERWLPDMTEAVADRLRPLLAEVVDDINFYIEEEGTSRRAASEDFDPKVLFKSAEGVRGVEAWVLKQNRRMAKKDEDYLFNLPSAR